MANLKKIILPLALSAIILLGCFDYSHALKIKKKSLRKTVEEMQLQVAVGVEKDATTDGVIADIGADLDVMRQDLTSINGKLEEKGFDTDQLRETIELLSQTLEKLEERIKAIESPPQEILEKSE